MTRLEGMSQDFRDAKNHVYGLAHNICINGREQKALLSAMADVEVQMQKDGEDGKHIILTLLSIIIDGLSYGNWPWIKNGVNTLS